MERELRRALIDEQFELVLQPQTDTLSGEVLGAEALIRWNHPEKGVVMPASFITYAEETGIIIELGDWVLREACRILRDKLTSRAHEGLVIAVNVSARQLAQTDFADKVLGILREYGIPGRRIELEITENILMLDIEHAIQQLNELTSFGVKVAVDDFGVGYSSLSYLHNLPLHTMKIDRSFISEIQSLEEKHSIVTGLIAMASELGLEVVAEGVETPVQLEFLKRIECPRSQGFLVGRPVPVSQFVSGAYR
jgi:EAL domain-containing protein (putative c-di-GMP-specific phosphodiesterase class I)